MSGTIEPNFVLKLEAEISEKEISAEEIDLIWSVLGDVIRMANTYDLEESD